MLPRMRVTLLLGLPLLLGLGVDAAAQVGRLGGNVAYVVTPSRPAPARGVTVVAVDANRQSWQARTDGNGNFVLTLRAGSYRVFAQGAPGYTTYGEVRGYVKAYADSVITPNPLFLVRSSSRRSGNLRTGPVLSHMAAWRGRTSTTQSINFTSLTAPQSKGRLYGRVVYRDSNEPARGTKVVAVDANRQSRQTRTDGNGNFVLALREGSYRVFAEGPSIHTTQGNVRVDGGGIITPNPLYLAAERRPMPTPTPTPTPRPRPTPTPRQPPSSDRP